MRLGSHFILMKKNQHTSLRFIFLVAVLTCASVITHNVITLVVLTSSTEAGLSRQSGVLLERRPASLSQTKGANSKSCFFKMFPRKKQFFRSPPEKSQTPMSCTLKSCTFLYKHSSFTSRASCWRRKPGEKSGPGPPRANRKWTLFLRLPGSAARVGFLHTITLMGREKSRNETSLSLFLSAT